MYFISYSEKVQTFNEFPRVRNNFKSLSQNVTQRLYDVLIFYTQSNRKLVRYWFREYKKIYSKQAT